MCQIVEAKLGLVPKTKCGIISTTQRSVSWFSLVTCEDCLAVMESERARVAEANRVRE